MALDRTRPDSRGRYSLIHVNVAGVLMAALMFAAIAIAFALPLVNVLRRWQSP